MYWAEVTMRDSNTKRIERNTLNEIFEVFGQYSRSQRNRYKATEIKFGKDNEQTGHWTPETGIKNV